MSRDDAQLDILFDTLANKHRRAIVYSLSVQPASISQLATQQGLSLPAIHKHIKVLEKAELVMRKKSGRCNFLALNRDALHTLRDWIEQYHVYWGSNAETLENYVNSIEKERMSRLDNKK